MKIRKILIAVLLVQIIFCSEAKAYIDPGTGSFVIQALIAGVAGFLYALKLYWANIKTFFAKVLNKNDQPK